MLRTDHPLSDEQIRRVAPSIFAEDKHASRSERYSYIPTAAVLTELRKEGFQPFMVCQTRVRDEGKREHTKHTKRGGSSRCDLGVHEARRLLLVHEQEQTNRPWRCQGQRCRTP